MANDTESLLLPILEKMQHELSELRSDVKRVDTRLERVEVSVGVIRQELDTVKTVVRKVEVVQDANIQLTSAVQTDVKVLLSAVSRNDKDIARLQSGKQDKA